jgi:hypothetical protein
LKLADLLIALGDQKKPAAPVSDWGRGLVASGGPMACAAM